MGNQVSMGSMDRLDRLQGLIHITETLRNGTVFLCPMAEGTGLFLFPAPVGIKSTVAGSDATAISLK
jgi:hypothetical protein